MENKKPYETPLLIEYGSIADRTLNNPGEGDKSSDTTLETDKFFEFSHPAAGS